MSGGTQLFSFELMPSPIIGAIEKAIIWQDSGEENTIRKLIEKQAQWYGDNVDQFWRDWFHNVFDLRTANEFGIAVWAIILNLPIETDLLAFGDNIFGFGPDSGAWQLGYGENFNYSNFSPVGDLNYLSLEEKRFLLRCRYFKLSMPCFVPLINSFLSDIIISLGGNNATCYVVDNLDMTATYTFNFLPSEYFKNALSKFDVLPRPSGVSITINFPS